MNYLPLVIVFLLPFGFTVTFLWLTERNRVRDFNNSSQCAAEPEEGNDQDGEAKAGESTDRVERENRHRGHRNDSSHHKPGDGATSIGKPIGG